VTASKQINLYSTIHTSNQFNVLNKEKEKILFKNIILCWSIVYHQKWSSINSHNGQRSTDISVWHQWQHM